MKVFFSNWRSRRRLFGLINAAIEYIYSGCNDFESLVKRIRRSKPSAKSEEIYLAIRAVYEIEGAFEDAVYSEEQVTDRKVIRNIVNPMVSGLLEHSYENDPEIHRLNKELLEAKAEHAFSSIRMAFAFADIAVEESFGGLVRKGNKIKKGPISITQRKRFKTLADDLEKANSTLCWASDEEKRLLAEQERLKNQLRDLEDEESDEEDDPRLAYPHAFNFHYTVDDDGDPLTAADYEIVETEVNSWSAQNNYFCELERNERGFMVSVWCFSRSGEGVGTNLFLQLSDKVFRRIGKGIRYI